VQKQLQNNKELVEKLLENGVQFGHKSSKFHPSMTPYVWGVSNGMHLIDLNKTAFLINHACEQIKEVTSRGGQVLWIGTKRQAQKTISEVSAGLKHPSVIHRWIGGTLTNSDQVKKAVTKLLHMRDVVAKPLAHYKKKQMSMLKKDLDRLEKNVSGIVNLKSGLALLVVVDVKREATAVKEAQRCGIPVIAVVDTNSSADIVETVIPANDDSQKSIEFILRLLGEAAQKGKDAYFASNPEEARKIEAAASLESSSSIMLKNERRPTHAQRRPSDAGNRRPGGRNMNNSSDNSGENSQQKTAKIGGEDGYSLRARKGTLDRRGGQSINKTAAPANKTTKSE